MTFSGFSFFFARSDFVPLHSFEAFGGFDVILIGSRLNPKNVQERDFSFCYLMEMAQLGKQLRVGGYRSCPVTGPSRY